MARTCSPVTSISFANRVKNTSMGIGPLGGPQIIFKRKFRWLFQIDFCNNQRHVPPAFVRTAARPDIAIDPTEINFLNEKSFIPGKATWNPVTVTYYDVASATSEGSLVELWSWLASVYDFTGTCRFMNSRRQDYAGIGTLTLLDGCGNGMEAWQMADMWPEAIKFGDLDYASSDVAEIELTLRYSQVEYQNYCGQDVNPCECTSC